MADCKDPLTLVSRKSRPASDSPDAQHGPTGSPGCRRFPRGLWRSDPALGPAEGGLSDADRATGLPPGDHAGESWITRDHRELRQFVRPPDVFGYLDTAALESLEQFLEIVGVGKAHAPLNEHRFDGLLGGLLRLEAELFVHRAHGVVLGECEIALRTVQPFAGIGRGIAFTRHTRPSPRATRDRSPDRENRDRAGLLPVSRPPHRRPRPCRAGDGRWPSSRALG